MRRPFAAKAANAVSWGDVGDKAGQVEDSFSGLVVAPAAEVDGFDSFGLNLYHGYHFLSP